MTLIKVDPVSVRQYGDKAQTSFGEIRARLQQLSDDVVSVNYEGVNAADFKKRTGQIAAQFSMNLVKDMGAMAEAVRVSTTNIAGSLGGSPITIQVNGSPITPHDVTAADFSQVETSALESLKGTITAHFSTVTGKLEEHKAALVSTIWEGTAKTNAVTAVGQLTTAATTKAEETQRALLNAIDAQVQATLKADA
jgi:hypothetical protein